MDTLEQYLRELYELIASAKKSVFSANDAIVNRGDALNLIERIRAAYPEVVRDAQFIVQDCDNQKQRTMEYCSNLIREAESRRDKILDENEILKQANEEAAVIRRDAFELRDRVEYDVKCKIDEVLKDSEVTLLDALTLIRNNREELRKTPVAAEQPAEGAYNAAENPNV